MLDMISERLSYLDSGEDSDVFRVGSDLVLKRYKPNITTHTLKAYVRVTNRAAQWGIVEPYTYPCGSTHMKWSMIVNPVIALDETEPVSVVSRYVPGPHGLKWQRLTDQELGASLAELPTEEQRLLALWKSCLWNDDLAAWELTYYWHQCVKKIEQACGVRGLEIKPMNVKPRANEHGIVWVVTDLAASLNNFSYC